jgi:hypothetical protein
VIPTLINDALLVNAKLECSSNRRETVDGDCRAGINVQDLGLAVKTGQAALIVVLRDVSVKGTEN